MGIITPIHSDLSSYLGRIVSLPLTLLLYVYDTVRKYRYLAFVL